MDARRVRARLLADGAHPSSVELFFAYHIHRPHLWAAFERVAIAKCQAGATRLSNKSIGEDIREDPSIANLGEFKISNTFLSYYARVFAEKYPLWGQLFEFKPLGGGKHEEDVS